MAGALVLLEVLCPQIERKPAARRIETNKTLKCWVRVNLNHPLKIARRCADPSNRVGRETIDRSRFSATMSCLPKSGSRQRPPKSLLQGRLWPLGLLVFNRVRELNRSVLDGSAMGFARGEQPRVRAG